MGPVLETELHTLSLTPIVAKFYFSQVEIDNQKLFLITHTSQTCYELQTNKYKLYFYVSEYCAPFEINQKWPLLERAGNRGPASRTLGTILQHRRHVSASHWNPSTLTHFNGYFKKNIANFHRENTRWNVSIYQDPNDIT